MAVISAVSGNDREHERLLRQRDQALAFAILAVAMTAVIIWCNFGREYTELNVAQQAVRQHRELLSENQKVMQVVSSAFQANQQALEKLSQAKRGSP